MGGTSTISTSETRIEALKLQSSAYGVTIPVVYGVNRIAGNMVWYGDFKAIPHTTTTSAGGKGGGVKTQNTTYTYSASVWMGLCHGQITGIPRIWRGKKLYSGGVTPEQVITVTENYTPPASGPMVFTVSQAASYSANGGVTVLGAEGTVTLAQGDDYTVANGVYTFLNEVWRYQVQPLQVTYQYIVGGVSQSALQQLGLSFVTGAIGQPVWSYLSSSFPSQALGYSGVAGLTGQDYDLGTGAQVENHTVEVVAPLAYHLGSGLPDVDPSRVLADLLTNSRYGAGFPARQLDGLASWSDYCVSAGLLMSPAIEEQLSGADLVKRMGELTNTAPVWSAGKLKMVPYGDATQTGNGRTYTPNTTPAYDLNDDNMLAEDGEPPIVVERKSPAEAYNHVRVEFLNRANQYNTETAEAKDQADIDTAGLRSMPIVTGHWFADAQAARTSAQLIEQRSLYVRAQYKFKLPANFVLLEPMDLVTLTDPALGLSKLPVRIVSVDEDNEDGDMSVTAEDYPAGVASATLYPSQSGAGYTHDYNVSPGNVAAPMFFEAPVERTETGLEVYVAVKGQNALWGGCRVWVSLDGTNFRQAATVYGGARYGTLTGPIAGGNLPVSTSGQLISGTAADAAALSTLCYIGGGTPEYLAYQGATLTGAGAYTLGGLVRGAYGTSQASAHAAGDAFVRVDDAIAKSGRLELSMIGKSIQFKFTSFNVYGAAEQSLADVTAYGYTISGVMAQLPPGAPTSLSYALEPFGIRLKCAKNPEPDVVGYEWRVGATWAGAQVLEQQGGTSYLWAVQQGGAFTAWVAAVDALGNTGVPASLAGVVPAPVMTSLTAAIVGADLQLDYAATPGAFAIDSYEVRYGDTYATATVVGVYKITRHIRRVDWGGARRWWVAAIDVNGNYGSGMSVDVTVTVPGAVTSSRSETVDNNALLYWAPPATGSLPIDRYEVRKGASWAAGTGVGSNGNSTFTAIFEQQSGQYTYWVAAYDTAGNIGTPVGIAATIAQPPDYILRVSIDSTFPGTRTNMTLDAGALYGPVDTSETWATHFSAHSWASPQDQVTAGFPLYAEPSVTSGSYDESFDYGTVLPATIITATLGYTVLAGSVAVSCQIYTKVAAGDAWTAAAAGSSSVLVQTFRYARVVWTFTCTAGANLIKVTSFNLKLANKLKTDSGAGTANAADVGGTVVNFNVTFIDADTPLVQPAGTSPVIPAVDFTDTPNPTSFKVLLFDRATGARVSGAFSWTARGY